MNEHLSFPRTSPPLQPTASASTSDLALVPSSAKAPLISNRLYVGNLHTTLDESTLLKLFSKFGKISRLDYLFHKAGPAKGKPRGFAFVEFSEAKDAKKAVDTLHDRLVRGRKLIVSFATQSSHPPSTSYDSYSSSGGAQRRRHHDDSSRPTTLSLIKTPPPPRSGGRGVKTSQAKSTETKIAALEAKLRQLQAPESEKPPGFDTLPRKPNF